MMACAATECHVPTGGRQAAPLGTCPDTSACPPRGRNATVFVIEGGDPHAAFATLFYLYVVNGVLYARHKGHAPWISLSPDWVHLTMGRDYGAGGRLWEYFFEPYCAGDVSAWIAACANVAAVHKPRGWYWPGLHGRFSWPVRA